MKVGILKHRNGRFLIFTDELINALIQQDFILAISGVMQTMGVTLNDLARDPKKMIEATSLASKQFVKKSGLETELFQAWNIFSKFYGANTKIGIEIKDGVLEKEISVRNFDEIKKISKTNTLVDFLIISVSGTRMFQLKNYYGNITTGDLEGYLKEVLTKYCKDLGDTNLLVVLSKGGDLSSVDFELLNQNLKAFGLKSDSWVMLSYNENNQKIVINQVFPELSRSEITLDLNYPDLIHTYKV